ncbi:hypothetical protein [Pseudomonas asplenii]|uniref:hypothetical protein n=1 Tax=Pseudomonas asplenii TaxID=53407 RepID=UPI00036E5A31|nr:hypothetical protein [Pseudomonas fuscovaginae]
MASKVLKSFLIGIGYDTKDLEAGDRKINASLQGIKSGALSISAALIGAFGVGAAAIVGVSDRVDKLAMSTQNLRTSMNTVYSFGNAVKLMGGDASEALDAIKGFEEIQNNLRLKGEAGPITDLATAGIDVSSLYKTQTGEEFMRALSEMIPRLDEGQRSQVQSSLGLSDGVFRSLAGGVEKLDADMERASGLTGSVDQLTDNARKMAENSSEFSLIIEGIKNELAQKFLPNLVGAGSALNDFLKDHRAQISDAVSYAADNPTAMAALGGSAVAAVTGATAAKLGLSTVGGAVSKAGTVGVAITGSAVGANLLNRGLEEHVPGYSRASRGFDDFLKSVTGLDRIQGPLELLFGGGGQQQKIEQPSTGEPETYSGTVIRSKEDIDYLDHRDRTAADSLPPTSQSTPEEDRQATADAFAGALARSPIKLTNELGLTIQLDGQALESKITQVNERQNYETLGDLKTTTER